MGGSGVWAGVWGRRKQKYVKRPLTVEPSGEGASHAVAVRRVALEGGETRRPAPVVSKKPCGSGGGRVGASVTWGGCGGGWGGEKLDILFLLLSVRTACQWFVRGRVEEQTSNYGKARRASERSRRVRPLYPPYVPRRLIGCGNGSRRTTRRVELGQKQPFILFASSVRSQQF